MTAVGVYNWKAALLFGNSCSNEDILSLILINCPMWLCTHTHTHTRFLSLTVLVARNDSRKFQFVCLLFFFSFVFLIYLFFSKEMKFLNHATKRRASYTDGQKPTFEMNLGVKQKAKPFS